MSDSTGDTFLFGFLMSLFFGTVVIVSLWLTSYNLPYALWKCVEEVQVGDDITNHECITYKKREQK